MPLKVKGVLLNIIGESGISKLIAFFRNSDNKNLQKHTVILLSSLIDNGIYFIYFFNILDGENLTKIIIINRFFI